MSDDSSFGFAKLVPGFDFLQNLAKGASQSVAQMPSLSNWVAPTINVEELDRRIAELKAVQFWLEQNGKALGATIQALEVQKMTLATLQGMNFSLGELASALTVKPADGAAGTASGSPAADAGGAGKKSGDRKADERKKTSGNGAAPVDPLQWWGALTQQFQQIAANAMKDVVEKTSADAARNMAAGGAKQPVKTAGGMAGAAAAPAKKAGARKAPARKRAPKTTTT